MKTVLIDSNFLAYRAKLKVGNLEYNGVPTGIMFGFFNQLITVDNKLSPDKIVFFWDSKENKRKEILPTYKEKRHKNQTEEEKKEWEAAFGEFNKLSNQILPNIGFTNNFFQKGYESDDLIAKYVLDKVYEDIYIVTGDDDLLQLLDYSRMYNPAKDKTIDAKKFQKDYAITPDKWIEVKKIAGCSSDNVPGITGVGEKTAIKYLNNELKKTSKKYKDIKENKELIEFNDQLVNLPFEGTKQINAEKDNQFSMKEFLRLCRDYNINTFRKEDKKEKIKTLFSNIK